MRNIKRIVNSRYFMVFLWIVIIVAVWEVFAFIVQFTKRTPVNILPHIYGIIESILDTKTHQRLRNGAANGSDQRGRDTIASGHRIFDRNGARVYIGSADEPQRHGRKNRVSLPHADTDDTGPRNGADRPCAHRRYRDQPYRHCRYPHLLSGRCQYLGRIQGSTQGKTRTHVFLRGKQISALQRP